MDAFMRDMAAFFAHYKQLLDSSTTTNLQPTPTPTPASPNPDCLQSTKKPTFAFLFAKPNDISKFSDQLPIPIQRGDVVTVEREIHGKEVESCKTNLIGRIMLTPRSKQ